MHLETILARLGVPYPALTTPGGNYVAVNIRGGIAYAAIQFPILNGQKMYQGRMGGEVSTAEGYQALQLCTANVLVHLAHTPGLDQIAGVNHIEVYYQAAGDWDEGPKIADGASDVLVAVLGDRGRHTRSLMGVAQLPRNFAVGLVVSCTLR
ncbi:MAG: RidA family protein [Bacteroidia bacterium]|nr:RidA family protein [Bacteroidia bacterium]